MDPALAEERIAEIVTTEPAWIIDTPAYTSVWRKSKLKNFNTAVFFTKNPEARAENLMAQLADIDCHFGRDTFPRNPYVGIRVIGLALSEPVKGNLIRFGFETFRATEDGFEADLRT